jgi:hypothetical protein
MPRWDKQEDGPDTTLVVLRALLTRTDYAILKSYMRDHADQNWTVRQALQNALQIGLAELGEAYRPGTQR